MSGHGVVAAGNDLHADLADRLKCSIYANTGVVSDFIFRRNCGIIMADADEPGIAAEQALFAKIGHEFVPRGADAGVRPDVAHERHADRLEMLDFDFHSFVPRFDGFEMGNRFAISVMHSRWRLRQDSRLLCAPVLGRRESKSGVKRASKPLKALVAGIKR